MRALALAVILLVGDNAKAADATSDIAKAHVPVEMRVIARQAVHDLDDGRYDAAASGFQAILDKFPGSLFAWNKLGVARMQQDDLSAACQAFAHAVRIDPNDSGSQADLGFCLFERRKYSAAIGPLEHAEALNPANSNVHAMLARCYAQTGPFDEARNERTTENLEQIDTYRE